MTDTATTLYDLVSFDRPPVQEIAFAVQLSGSQLSLEVMVDIGRALKPSFPVQQLQPALPRMMQPGVQSFSVSVGAPLPRFWFVSEDGLRLVQVQEDRVAFNWRRLGRDAPYPRYGRLRADFEQHLARMAQIAPELADDRLQADICELTYVNELETPGPSAGQLPLDAVLRMARPLSDGDFLPDADDGQWTGRWTIRNAEGQTAGRLVAAAQPASRQHDQRPIYLLTMTGIMDREVRGGAAAFEQFDLAHEWIVRGFADLTTKDMHDQWGRTR